MNESTNAATNRYYQAPELPRRRKCDVGKYVDMGLLAVSGVVTFGVGNWSIATVLGDAGAPTAAAVGAAGVFDLIAVSAAVRVHRLRLTPHRAFGAQLVMLTALVVSMVVNAAHGWAIGGWMSALVLGAVPLAFEIVWAMQHGIKPWTVRRQFKDEAREMVRRDAHAALYGMTVPLPSLVRDSAIVVSVVPSPALSALSAGLSAGQDAADNAADSPADERTEIGPLVRAGFQSTGRADGRGGQGRGQRTTKRTSEQGDSGQADTVSGLIRELVRAGQSADVIRSRVSATFPDSNPDSVARIVRRELGRAVT